MRKGKIISTLIALFLGFFFILGSTGITVVLHSCHHCGDLSVRSGIFLPPEEPEDHCCEFAGSHDHESGLQTFIGENCHFKIDRIKLVNYAPSGKIIIDIPVEIPFTYSAPHPEGISGAHLNSNIFHNKHGGRSMITSMCQLLS